MNTALKLLLSLALLAALGGVAAILWLRPAPSSLALEPDKPTEKTLEAPRNAPVESQEKLAAEAPSSERTSVPKDAQGSPDASKPTAAQAEASVVAHIVDESLRPIANAWLRPEQSGPRSGKADPGNEARTGSDGVATLHWKGSISPYSTSFSAGADGYGTVFPRGILRAGETLHLGDLVLHPGGSVRGRVVDSEQHPVTGAEVVVSDEHALWGSNDLEQLKSRGPSTWLGAPQTRSAEDGTFLVEGVVAGMTRAWAKSGNLRWAVSEPLELVAGNEVRDVVLVVDPANEGDAELRDIQGIVVGPDDKPIPKARMQVRQRSGGSSWSSGANAEEDGRFRVHPRDRDAKIFIEFSDPADRYTQVSLVDVKPGTKDLVVRLEEPRMILLAARDEHGPVENFRVRWVMNEWDVRGYLDKQEAHADGRASVRVPTQSAFMLEVLAPGHVSEKLGLLEGSKLPAELAVELKTIPGIHGRVLSGENPVSGAKLLLHEQPQNAEIEMNGFATLVQPRPAAETTSDSDGRFTLDLKSDGSFSIFADAEGYARAQYGPALLETRKGLQELVIQLDAGGTLEGKVLMPPGRSPAGVIVGINRGDAHPFTQVVGPEGTFRFERLTPGAWEIRRSEQVFSNVTSTSMSSGSDTQARTIRRDFTIAVGQTTRMDLDLRHAEPCMLEIQLSNNSGPARAWSVVAWPKGKHTFTGSPPSAATDSNGHARIEIDDPGECALTITPPAESGSEFKFQADLTLQRGSNNWSQDIHTGRVEGTIAGWQPEAAVQWRLGESGAPYFGENTLRPDSSGHFVVPFLPVGTIEVLRIKSDEPGHKWELVQSFELAAGQTKTLQLP